MKIYNFTGRNINLYNLEDTFNFHDKLVLRSPSTTEPQAVLTCNGDTPEVYSSFETLKYGDAEVVVQKFEDADRITDFCPDFDVHNDILVSTNIWVQTVRRLGLVPAHAKLATVYGLVRSRERNFYPIGCLGLESK